MRIKHLLKRKISLTTHTCFFGQVATSAESRSSHRPSEAKTTTSPRRLGKKATLRKGKRQARSKQEAGNRQAKEGIKMSRALGMVRYVRWKRLLEALGSRGHGASGSAVM